jgi:small GTP-binding protein
MTNSPQLIKVAVLGDGGVGKTAVVIQFVSNHFPEGYDPTIEDWYRRNITVDAIPVLLEILDTAGQAEFTPLRDQWIRFSDGFILVYNITSRQSFDELRNIKKHIDLVKEDENIPLVLVGNKKDLDTHREVAAAEAQQLSLEWRTQVFETSAKTRDNIDPVFQHIVRLIRAKKNPSTKPHKIPKHPLHIKNCKLL